MKTAGQILKAERLRKKLSIARVAKATKIRPLYLKALENDRYQELPSPTSARGFVRNYADFLGLPLKDILAVFRRDFDEKKVDGRFGGETLRVAAKAKFNWTPKLTTIAAAAILIGLFLAYLVWQYLSLKSAPYY